MNLNFRKNVTKIIIIAMLTLLCISAVNAEKAYADVNSWSYDFTGKEQTFIAPYAGTYTFELWGAEGGSWNGVTPGKGGYSKGQINLNAGQTLYVYVGGSGSSGGYNGGGSAPISPTGGGATDIRTSSSGNWKDYLDKRIIVAGGGGSSEWYNGVGGAGGGLTGGSGSIGTLDSNPKYNPGQGGTQTSGGYGEYANGTFGQGGSGTINDGGGSGGGGWYGGGTPKIASGGGGGSSYIGGVSNGITISGDTSMPSTNGGNEIGHSGNGFVKITYQNPMMTLTEDTTSDTTGPVTIKVSASSSVSEIVKIQTPDGEWIDGSTIDYVVNKNGTYSFTAIDKEERETTKSITISNINSSFILNVEPDKSNINLNETVSTNLTIDNITDIAAEDVKVKYDNTKLQFLGYEQVDGIILAKTSSTGNELRFILASKGASNIVNSKKTLLKLKFKGIDTGYTSIDVASGMVSDGIKMKKTLEAEQCGGATIKIANIEQ